MTVLQAQGFDNVTAFVQLSRFGTYGTTGGSPDAIVAGRFGGNALQIGTTSLQPCRRYFNFSGLEELCTGVAFRLRTVVDNGSPTGFITFMALAAGTTHRFNIQVDAVNGHLRLADGADAEILTNTGVNLLGADWRYIEVYYLEDATNGRIIIWLDDDDTPTIDFTGDTSGADITRVLLLDMYQASAHRARNEFDDWYITTGERLGESRCVTLRPIGDDGENEWTPSTPGDHYLMVDEQPTDEGATYLESAATPGNAEAFDVQAFTDIGFEPAFIRALAVTLVAFESTSGNLQLRTLLRQATDSFGASINVPTSGYALTQTVYTDDPQAAAPWTRPAAALARCGFEVASGTTGVLRVSTANLTILASTREAPRVQGRRRQTNVLTN